MMKIVSILIFCFFFLSCGYSPEPTYRDQAVLTMTGVDESTEYIETLEEESDVESATRSNLLAFNDQEPQTLPSKKKSSGKKNPKKIIKTATLDLQVVDYRKSRQTINTIVETYDAYISNEVEQNRTYRLENTLKIRIEPEKLELFILDLEKLASEVVHKNISSKDVTKSFLDIEIRLQTKRDVIKRYRELLQQANSVKDILAVEQELQQVVEALEAMEGELNYLKDQIGYSTVTVTLFENIEISVAHRKSFFPRIGKALAEGWQGFLDFTVGLFSIWPFLLLFGGLIFMFRRYLKNRKRHLE